MKRRAVAALLALVALGWGVGAPALAEPRRAPRQGHVETGQLDSEAVAQRRSFLVYLPPGYARAEAPLPVIYLLHGLGGEPEDWRKYAHLFKVADALIDAEEIAPVVLVAPDGGNEYWTDHLHKPKERWGRFVARDLIDAVEARYNVRRDAGGRAIVGVSMGGHGALSLALAEPRRFVAAVSLSGALFPKPPTHRKIYKRVWGSPADSAHWQATSPIALMRALRRGAKAPAIYLQCGDDDGAGFLEDALLAHRLLRERRIPHELRINDGGHRWSTWAAMSEDWLRFVDRAWR